FPAAPVILENEIRIYYGASDWYFFDWRKGHLALATLRPDGWAGYRQIDKLKPAVVTTTPVACGGGRLRVSADVAAGGFIRVAVRGKDRQKLAVGVGLTETVTDAEIKWPQGFSLESLSGELVRLEFELIGAQLYSFSFQK
ncbi:MAG: hypothetical protein VB875_18910, partial [Pirellulales bacterium]